MTWGRRGGARRGFSSPTPPTPPESRPCRGSARPSFLQATAELRTNPEVAVPQRDVRVVATWGLDLAVIRRRRKQSPAVRHAHQAFDPRAPGTVALAADDQQAVDDDHATLEALGAKRVDHA